MEHALRQTQERVQDALARRVPLRLRGGGSKDFYGQSLQGEVLDTRVLSGVVSYEPTELVVTAGAGTSLAALESVLAEKGQCLPFEPPHYAYSGQGGATVGGMVAAGLSGPARASVGSVRDYVLGLKVINGLGQHLSFGGQVMKNVAGYDVSRLMVGAMGTLGLMTEVSLKVLPLAPAQATLQFELPQAQALEQLHRWGGLPRPLNASCWVRDATGTGASGRELLFVRLAGAVAAVEAACRTLLADQAGQRVDPDQARTDWNACRDHGLPFFTHAPDPDLVLWRVSLPQTAPVLDLPWATLVEWHGGLRWLWAPLAEADGLQKQARALGGFAMPFIAAPALSMGSMAYFNAENKTLLTVHQRLKDSFDPHGIFNPGRWLAGK
ncbi:MAG: glycolate oxidase subunit GlcE [Burkholderiales bacterium PBB3]|nr:MAG: glycolate oxidase subunit GlcE [Burkholderiales bacterium PBB3]